MNHCAYEIIDLEAGVNYAPTLLPNKNYGKTWQIGADAPQGFARGPVYKLTFVSLGLASATHVKIWAVDNQDDSAPEFPVTYLTALANKEICVYLKKFEFTDGSGLVVAEADTAYQIVGYKLGYIPIQGMPGN